MNSAHAQHGIKLVLQLVRLAVKRIPQLINATGRKNNNRKNVRNENYLNFGCFFSFDLCNLVYNGVACCNSLAILLSIGFNQIHTFYR